MERYMFRKKGKILYVTSDGRTAEYTPDGDVDSSLEHIIGEEISQEEAEKMLNQYGWYICKKCGRIEVDGQDCEWCQKEERTEEEIKKLKKLDNTVLTEDELYELRASEFVARIENLGDSESLSHPGCDLWNIEFVNGSNIKIFC